MNRFQSSIQKILYYILALGIFAGAALAHVEEAGAALPPAVDALIGVHDSVHWIVFLFFIWSCYQFRYLWSRIRGHPVACPLAEPAGRFYGGEDWLRKGHRWLFWLMLVFALIHLLEASLQAAGLATYTFAPLQPFVWPFTIEPEAGPVWAQAIGFAVEWLYVLSMLAFLLSCHYLRHFMRTRCGPCYRAKLTDWHGLLFYIFIASAAALLLLGSHL